jgi:hypothetical protein
VTLGKALLVGIVAGVAYALGEKIVDVAWTKVFPGSPCGCGGGAH